MGRDSGAGGPAHELMSNVSGCNTDVTIAPQSGNGPVTWLVTESGSELIHRIGELLRRAALTVTTGNRKMFFGLIRLQNEERTQETGIAFMEV